MVRRAAIPLGVLYQSAQSTGTAEATHRAHAAPGDGVPVRTVLPVAEVDSCAGAVKEDPGVSVGGPVAVPLERPELVCRPEHEIKEDDVDSSVRATTLAKSHSNKSADVFVRGEGARPRLKMCSRSPSERLRELEDVRGVVANEPGAKADVSEVPPERARVREDG